MTQLLFYGATANVKVNGSQSPEFGIHWGVRQGCPLAPYLFLIVVEVENTMVKKGVEMEVVKGVSLPVQGKEQVIAQFVDNT